MYDPNPARFTSEDPMGFGAGDPNLYRYVKNAPTNATDPSGLAGYTWNPGEPPPGQDESPPPPPPADPGGGQPPRQPTRQEYDFLTGQINTQRLNWSIGASSVHGWQQLPLYQSDATFAALVNEYAKLNGQGEIQAATVANGATFNNYLQNQYTPPTPMSPAELRAWLDQRKKLNVKIVDYLRRAGTPRINRFTLGVIISVARTGDGAAQMIASPDKVVEGLEKVVTDSKVREQIWDAVVAKVTSGDAQDLGELTVDVTLAATGAVGATKITVKVGKEAVKAIRDAGPKIKETMRVFWKDIDGSIPGGPTPGRTWAARFEAGEFATAREAANALREDVLGMTGARQADKVAAYRRGADAIEAQYGRDVWRAKEFMDKDGAVIFAGANAEVPANAPVLIITDTGAIYKGKWGEIIRSDGQGRLWANLFSPNAVKLSD